MSPASADHQPLARLEAGRYRPACLCGWQDGQTYELRAEALVIARVHDENALDLPLENPLESPLQTGAGQ